MMTAPHRTNDWFREDIFRLIELYRDRPCLWNQDHPDRRNKVCKDQSWTEIVDLLQVERTEIERKIKSLYTQFFREYKKKIKIESIPGCENVFKSKWFAFEELLFLSKRLKERSVNQYVTEDDDSFTDIMRMSHFNNSHNNNLNNTHNNNSLEQQQHLHDQHFQDQLIMQHEYIMQQQQQQQEDFLNDYNNPPLKRKCSEMFEDNDYDDHNKMNNNNNRNNNDGNNSNSCGSGIRGDNGVVVIDCKDDNGSDNCDTINIQNGCLNDLDNAHPYVNNRHDNDMPHVTRVESGRSKRKEKTIVKNNNNKVAKRYNKKTTNNSAFESKTFTSNSLHTNKQINTHTTSIHKMHTNTYNNKDEYSVYGELVACKLRKLPSQVERSNLQRQISEILYRAEMKSYSGPESPYFKGCNDGVGFDGGGEGGSVEVGSDNGVDDGSSSVADECNTNGNVGCGGVDEKVHEINGDGGDNDGDDGGGGDGDDYVVGGGQVGDVFVGDTACNGTDNDLDLTCSPVHHNDNDRSNDDKIEDNNDKRGDDNEEFSGSPYSLLSEPYQKHFKQELN